MLKGITKMNTEYLNRPMIFENVRRIYV